MVQSNGHLKFDRDLQTSLETIRQINWFDGIHKLPNDVDKKLLDQCSDLIQEFLEGNELTARKSQAKRKVQKRQGYIVCFEDVYLYLPSTDVVSKPKKSKRKIKGKASRVRKLKKNIQPFNYAQMPSTNNYHHSCFRSSGPINCPKKKLPMPRDLWYRIVYSQALEQQLVSSGSSPAKRKHKEDESDTENLHKNQSNSTNPRQQQTMNAVISLVSNKMIKVDDLLQKSESTSYPAFPKDPLEYIAETLPLETACAPNRSSQMHRKIDSKAKLKTTLWTANLDQTIPSTQSAHVELLTRPKIYRGLSADATLERIISTPSAPSASILLKNESSPIQPSPSTLSIQEHTNKNTDDNAPTISSITFDHPLINQLFEYYNLDDIPHLQLFKQLNRRLRHIRQSLKTMSSNDIELKLKYKRDALVKKRQTPVQSLTKDERIAMAELELNIYEYVQVLDEPSSKSFHVIDNDVLQTEPLYDTVVPPVKSVMLSESSIEPSVSTFNTVQPSPISQSTARLSTITQFSERTEKLTSWTHPLETNLLNLFEPLTPTLKAQIHKQLARRYEHICTKAQELSRTQLQAQIDSKSKALEQSKKLYQPNKTELLRIAELELSLFELRHEQTQRNQVHE